MNEQVKNHFKKYKQAYITGGVCLLTGAALFTVYAINQRHGNVVMIAGRDANYKSKITTIEVNLERRGHPGYIVHCVETGETFASQARTAECYGINQVELSRHLNGHKEDVKGLHFERLGEAA